HFLVDAFAEEVGWKAVARVISDFAAMGGEPDQLLVSVALPASTEVEYVEGLYRGMKRCADDFSAEICGGETSSVPDGSAAVITISGTGWVKRNSLTLRSNASAGDAVLVTGRLGGSIRGKHLTFTPRVDAARWLSTDAAVKPTAMMDLSDGIGKDLPRLARASGCGYSIDEDSLPKTSGCSAQQALGDGEDYELLLTVPQQQVEGLLLAWKEKFPKLELTQVGMMIKQEGGAVAHESGGWEHFSSDAN
ncbi:MAG: thiamine-phosphate kinase, partial [Akkermansiaceae bacterium]